jgi:hypothetical protein
VVNILEEYGLFHNRDWSEKLQWYFLLYWSHLWLPWNGQPNKITIDRKRYIKHTAIDLEATNEPSSLEFLIFGNYALDSDFGNFCDYVDFHS